uniref:Uncharacterized protein n=1 Tax=Phytophthora ramorum TaxID=164328 RepID=H3H2M9_PHYRM
METKQATSTARESLIDTVERLRIELRRKEEESCVAQTEFTELSASSREVEQELESDISRLSRLSGEQEHTIVDLGRRLQNERRRAISAETQSSALGEQVAQLRQRLQALEQGNDDLRIKVRRLEGTEEDLAHRLERAQEEVVFAQLELEVFAEEAGQATTTSNSRIRDLTAELDKYKALVGFVSRVIAGECDSDEDAEGPLNTASGNPAVSKKADTIKATGKSEQELFEVVKNLRAELQIKTEQLQTTEDRYDKFVFASHELEKALASENADLKTSRAEVQAENVLLRCLLQTERERSAMEPWRHGALP